MPLTTTRLEIRGLGKRQIAALAQKAKRLGMTPERYVRQLVEEDLSLEKQAQSTTFAELMQPVRAEFTASGMSESELDILVDSARSRHSRRTSGKRRKK
jgi:hypothetical protein